MKKISDYATVELGNKDEVRTFKFAEGGVMNMAGIVAGLLVCVFVYVIRESLVSPEEEM